MTDITVTTENAIQTLRFTRPAKKNAITGAMYAALSEAFAAGDANPEIAVHVLLGSDGVFTAGNDIKDFLAAGAGGGDVAAQILRFVRTLPQVKKPIVAAVDGLAVGIGTTLLFHCDLVYATPEASFSTPFADLALVPEAGSSLLMPRRLGYARAFEMLGLGAAFSAERMREAGLVNAIVPKAELEVTALKAAMALARKPPAALRAARKLMRGDPAEILARIDEEAAAFTNQLASAEARSAFEAFLTRGRG